MSPIWAPNPGDQPLRAVMRWHQGGRQAAFCVKMCRGVPPRRSKRGELRLPHRSSDAPQESRVRTGEAFAQNRNMGAEFTARGWSRTQIKHKVPKTSSSLVDAWLAVIMVNTSTHTAPPEAMKTPPP